MKQGIKKDFLVLLLSELQKNEGRRNPTAQNLEISNQNLSYHLNKLIIAGFVEKKQSYPYAIYSLTPLGVRIKEILVQSENGKKLFLWRVHDLIIGFDVYNFGSFNFTESKHRKLVQMNNWNYALENVKDSYGKWNIHIQSTGLMKIYCPSVYTQNSDETIAKLQNVAYRISDFYKKQYGMETGQLKLVRLAHKELVNSEKLGELFGKTRINKVWADASTGTQWLEEEQNENGIERLLEMPGRIDKLEDHLIKQTEVMDKFALQIELHLSVMQEMKETMKAIREELKK